MAFELCFFNLHFTQQPKVCGTGAVYICSIYSACSFACGIIPSYFLLRLVVVVCFLISAPLCFEP